MDRRGIGWADMDCSNVAEYEDTRLSLSYMVKQLRLPYDFGNLSKS